MPSVQMTEMTQHNLLKLCNLLQKKTTTVVEDLITAALLNMGQEITKAAAAGQKKEDFVVDRLRRLLDKYEAVEKKPVVIKLPPLVHDGFALLAQAAGRELTPQMAWMLTEKYLEYGYFPPHSANWGITRRTEQIESVTGR